MVTHDPTRYHWRERLAEPIDEAIRVTGLTAIRNKTVWTIAECTRKEARRLHVNLRIATDGGDEVEVGPLPRSERLRAKRRIVLRIPTRSGDVEMAVGTKVERTATLMFVRTQLRYARMRHRRALARVQVHRDVARDLEGIKAGLQS